ncbi:hypothetical protein [Acidocella aromatica]|uniref:Uncharacterized protein n=1 Tax=Acidocella aromatica TaxID=1303579 RepID=A0A840VE16_9PROT|nr:hypothetical protein [Acidocella aromatica]MBB5373117.1 hypothetical protein [Acidocella aromatica]
MKTDVFSKDITVEMRVSFERAKVRFFQCQHEDHIAMLERVLRESGTGWTADACFAQGRGVQAPLRSGGL